VILALRTKDIEAGTFRDSNSSYRGQVSGLEFTFDYGNNTGTLTLADDNTMDGVVRVGRNTQFKATARLR
jgi:hypothetical protein